MNRTALINRSIPMTFVGIAATLALAACGTSSHLAAAPAATPAASKAPVADVDPAADVVKTKPTRHRVVATHRPTRPAAAAPQKSASLKYVKIVEPFGSAGRCDENGNTLEMTACFLKKVEDVDYTVDVLQRQRFEYGISTADRKADLRDDASWLARRTKTCSANLSGGSMDQITEAQCLLKVSKQRVKALS